MTQITIDHEFKSLIPPLSDAERAQLEANLIADGCREPLVTWSGILLDGHNRYAICTANGIAFQVVEQEFASRADATLWIINNQFGRRNLTNFVRAELALKMEPVVAVQAKERERLSAKGLSTLTNPVSTEPVHTRQIVASVANVSEGTLHKAKYISEKAPEEVKQQLRSGETSINAAYTEIKKDEAQARKREAVEEIAARPAAPIEKGVYSVLYADPPWRYDFSRSDSRQVENQYPTLTVDEICALPVPSICETDCVLFLWATSPKLPEALRVMAAWGFEYKTCAVWVKERIGMGYYFRQRHEILLVGTRGSLPVPEPPVRPDSVIEAPRGKHSEKPEQVYGLIEAMYPGLSKIELFARSPRSAWSAWGNQA